MTSLIEGRAAREGIGVVKVNPAYTSLIGKVKHMRRMGRDVHNAAAYVIGRRAMGLKERAPAYLRQCVPGEKKNRHHWSQFACLMPAVNGKRKSAFFRKLPAFGSVKELKDFA